MLLVRLLLSALGLDVSVLFSLAAPLAVSGGQKYFMEAAEYKPFSFPAERHYDRRFFRGVLSEDEKRPVQVKLVRAYLETFRSLGLETWIAHGTLLGWWWQQKIMPWDTDSDAQIMESTLIELATRHNNSLNSYGAAHETASEHTTYLLDVNPYALGERTIGNGNNIIDARWIDTGTGLYIDITALSELDSLGEPGVVSCKNGHRYRLSDLFPLQESAFEGVPALIPSNYVRILVEEYGWKAIVREHFQGHRWNWTKGSWIRESNSYGIMREIRLRMQDRRREASVVAEKLSHLYAEYHV